MRAPHHNFVVIASMTIKFGTDIKLDVYYTMVIKTFVTSMLLSNYDVTYHMSNFSNLYLKRKNIPFTLF